MFGAILGGIGSFLGGTAGAVGGAVGGLGTMITQPFGAAGSAGLFGTGGQFALPQAMSTLGMGLGVAQAYGGGTSTGGAPTARVKLSKEGKALESQLLETADKQYGAELLPENLASIYIGKIKRQEGEAARIGRGLLTSVTGIKSGRQVMGAITEGAARMEGGAAPAKWQAAEREEEFRNALATYQNIRNMELQTGVLNAQTQLTRGLMTQMQGAARGQALGDVAQYISRLRYPVYPV